MYLGWGALGGVEVWNNQRVHEYAWRYLPGLMSDCDCGCTAPHLAAALGDKPYQGPVFDLPDWYDPDDSRSAEFYGAHALSQVGMEDSTRETVMTETLGDGGAVGLSRHTMKQVRITALLVAGNDSSLQYGFAWLKRALSGEACGEAGDRFCFLAVCPPMCEDSPNLGPSNALDDCVTPHLRYLRQVSVDGPRVIERYAPSKGALMRVEFILTAARPFVYGEPTLIATSGLARPPVRTQTNMLTDPSSFTVPFTDVNPNATVLVDAGVGRTSRSTRSTVTTATPTVLDVTINNTTTALHTPVSSPAVAGDTWSAVVHLRTNRPGRRGVAGLRFYNGSTLLSEVLGSQVAPPSTGLWTPATVTAVAPAGTTGVRGVARVSRVTGVAPIGEQAWATDAALIQGAGPVEFFSGDTPDSADGQYRFSWDGTANASTSRRDFIDYDVFLYETDAEVQNNVTPHECASPVVRGVVRDPLCPPLPAPPLPPSIDPLCLPEVAYVTSRAILVPGRTLPEWADGVPLIELSSTEAIRQVRIRFYAAPLGQDYADVDSCGYCGEFIVGYLPAGVTLELDGMAETAMFRHVGDYSTPARHLLYGTGGGPFEWPVLSCGTPYWVVIDSPDETDSISKFTVSIATRE